MQVNVEPVQPGSTPPAKALATLNSYPDILHNFGFCSADILARQLQPWLSRFAELKPDILIIDHSPSALLANRLCRRPCVSSGNGFTVPPRTSPMRPLRYWAKQQDEQLLGNERRVLDVANLVLGDAGAVPMGQISDLLLTDAEWLLSFPELDHYGERDGARYLGTFPADDFGITPQWAGSSGPKIFAYLSQASVTSEFLDALHRLNVNLCLYAPNLAPGEIDKFNGERTCRSNSPVKLVDAVAQCDAAITNGSLNTVAALLSYGKPVLALPSSLERYMVGRRLELSGCGLMAPHAPGQNLTAKLYAVLNDWGFARAAAHFSRSHASGTALGQTNTMLADIDRLLARDPGA